MDNVVVLLAMDAGDPAQLALAVLDRVGQVTWSAVDLVDLVRVGAVCCFDSFNFLLSLADDTDVHFGDPQVVPRADFVNSDI